MKKITDQTSIDNTQEWDSFSGLLLESEVEKEFNINLTTAEIVSVKCIKDIKEILKKKGVIA